MPGSNLTAKPLLARFAVGLLIFVGLDAAVFRSGLYARIMSPTSIAGDAVYTTRYEKLRKADPAVDVLLTGDSRMGEGFSQRLANADADGKGLHFVQIAIPGSSLRAWYYMLKYVDPQADRYKSIVLTVPSYREVASAEFDLPNRMLDADILDPIIGFADQIDLARHFTTPEARLNIWARTLLSSMNYRMDFQDLLLHPKKRRSEVKWRKRLGDQYAIDYDGQPATMDGLAIDKATGALSYPERLTDSERSAVDTRFKHPQANDPVALDAYNQYWLSRIGERYAHSKTRIVVARMPTSPLPAAFDEEQKPMAHFVSSVAAGHPNITLLPEGAFLNLEAPTYFFDTYHLNAEGRKRLTAEMVKLLADLAQQSAPGAQVAHASGGVDARAEASALNQ
jgi:hypothetical protein